MITGEHNRNSLPKKIVISQLQSTFTHYNRNEPVPLFRLLLSLMKDFVCGNVFKENPNNNTQQPQQQQQNSHNQAM